MNRAAVLLAPAILALGCGPAAPDVAFEEVVMNADGLSYTVRTTPGARVHGGPGFATGTADPSGRAQFHMPLAEVDMPEYHVSAEVEGTFGTAYGDAILTLPTSVEEAQMVRPDGSPFLAVVTVTSDELTEAGHCLVEGDFGGNSAPIGPSGRCGFMLRAPAGTAVSFDGAPVDTSQRVEVDFTAQLSSLGVSMFGAAQQIERTYAVEVTAPSGQRTSGAITVSALPIGPVLRGQLTARAGRAALEGAPSADVAAIVGPEAGVVGLLGRGTPARVEGVLGTASRIVIATDGATREAPPCTGYHVEGGSTEASLSRLTTDVELRVYDAATSTELGRTTVAGPGTGCPMLAESDHVVNDRPTDEALAAAIWAMGR